MSRFIARLFWLAKAKTGGCKPGSFNRQFNELAIVETEVSFPEYTIRSENLDLLIN